VVDPPHAGRIPENLKAFIEKNAAYQDLLK
jgi:hypothetical protein